MAERRRVLLVGGGDLAEEVCEALDAGGAEVTWLEHADDESLREAVGAKPDVVCVATRDDAFPLRIALLVRHLDEDVPLLVTIFDPGIAKQIAETVPNCRVTSLADIVAPSLAGPCIAPDLLAVLRDGERTSGSATTSRRPSCRPARRTGRAASSPPCSTPTTAAPRCCSTASPGSSRCCRSSCSAR